MTEQDPIKELWAAILAGASQMVWTRVDDGALETYRTSVANLILVVDQNGADLQSAAGKTLEYELEPVAVLLPLARRLWSDGVIGKIRAGIDP